MEFIMTYIEVGDSRIFKSMFENQLNGNSTLFKDQLTRTKVGNLYMKPRLLNAENHDSILNLGCDYGVCFWNTSEVIFYE